MTGPAGSGAHGAQACPGVHGVPQRLRDDELTAADLERLREIWRAAFPGRWEEPHDEDHSMGGVHVVVRDARGVVTAHAAVVPRELLVDGEPWRAGYLEGVAVPPGLQGSGWGTLVSLEASRIVREQYEMGALSTSRQGFYERLGWSRWRGPSWVLGADGSARRTPEEDAGLMVLAVPGPRRLPLTAPIACHGRPGDDW